ncbi:hypothetical protein [Amycolatopsis oliviviridis]|uniref:Uncharacterized protein n=1 Tax=Amycolatopsis oliviviridis TaxID=1471590 RepID=A0ABQ3LYS1_9PSEU|nr:hypothetical protein [Amycolatopsis oliviviridis]GHH29156.1 hypothetical protein GCM10017790_60840 [Amycolatopsis oliviviridis]
MVTGVSVPAAQVQAPANPPYTLKTEPADLTSVRNGDPVRITLSGLPAGATAKLLICPKDVPDNLLKRNVFKPPFPPEHSLDVRVSSYCGEFNDELVGARVEIVNVERKRSSTSGDIVFDFSMPLGSLKPQFVPMDPLYTSYVKNNFFPWADNPEVVDPGTGAKTRRQFSFKCDEKNPCTFALRISAPNSAGQFVSWADDAIKFTPARPDIGVQGCKGSGQNTLNASMPERLGRTAVTWNQALCAPTEAEQPANIVSETEDAGLTAFDKGTSDLAITGSGGVLAGQAVRDRQYVPVGVNAAVVAAVGWSPTDLDDSGGRLNAKFTGGMRFTRDELANMFTKGGQDPAASGRGGIFRNDSALVGRNPALSAMDAGNELTTPIIRAGVLNSTSFFGVTGEGGPGTVPLTLSKVLSETAAAGWVFPSKGKDYFGELDGKSPGVISDLNALDPGRFSINNVDAKTGQLAVRKTVNEAVAGSGAGCAGGCMNWVITDLATARAYGWAPVAIPDGKGNFVRPTDESLALAANAMKVGEDGTLQVGTATKDGAYPLTFVEYMVAPVNPLIDATCKPMPEKQAQLRKFVNFAAGYGQGQGASGMPRLTPGLAATAIERAAKIGTGTAKEACQEREEAKNPPPAGGTGATPVANSSLTGPAGGPGSTAGTSGTAAAMGPAPAATSTPESVLAAKNLAESITIPKFAGAGVLGALIPLVALVILATLPSATAYVAAGRPVPRWLTVALAGIGAAFAMLFGLLRRKPAGGAA